MRALVTAGVLAAKEWGGFGKTAATVQPIIDLLVKCNWLRPYRQTGPQGGSPAPHYAVNPHVFRKQK